MVYIFKNLGLKVIYLFFPSVYYIIMQILFVW